MPSTSRRHQWRFAIDVSLLIAAVIPITTSYLLIPQVVNFPRWDQWHLIPLWKTYYENGNVFPLLVKPYQNHVLIIPHSIIFLMGIASHWDIRFEVIASFVVTGVTLLILLRALQQTDDRLLILGCCVSAQVFSLAAYENLLAGYQLTQNLSQMFATSSAYLITCRELKTRNFVWSVVLAVLAAASWGGGLAACYVVFGVLLLRRPLNLRFVIIAALVAASFTLIAKLLISQRPAFDFVRATQFYFALIGKSAMWHPLPRIFSSSVCGVLALLILTTANFVAFRLGVFELAARWSAFGLLALGSAALIDLGRFDVGLNQALVSRYLTSTYLVLLAIVVIVALLLLRAYDSTSNPIIRVVLCVCVGLLAATPLLQQARIAAILLPILRSWSTITRSDTGRVVKQIASDEEIHRSFHPDAALVRSGVEVLRKNHLTLFAHTSHYRKEGASKPLPRGADN